MIPHLHKYKIIECPKCKIIQLTTAKETFHCQNCKITKKIKKKNKLGLSIKLIKSFPEHKIAMEYLKEYNKQKSTEDGFKTLFTMEEKKPLYQKDLYVVGLCKRCQKDIFSDENWEVLPMLGLAHQECPKENLGLAKEEEVD